MDGHDGHDTATDDCKPSVQRLAQRPRSGRPHKHEEVDPRRDARSHDGGKHY